MTPQENIEIVSEAQVLEALRTVQDPERAIVIELDLTPFPQHRDRVLLALDAVKFHQCQFLHDRLKYFRILLPFFAIAHSVHILSIAHQRPLRLSMSQSTVR